MHVYQKSGDIVMGTEEIELDEERQDERLPAVRLRMHAASRQASDLPLSEIDAGSTITPVTAPGRRICGLWGCVKLRSHYGMCSVQVGGRRQRNQPDRLNATSQPKEGTKIGQRHHTVRIDLQNHLGVISWGWGHTRQQEDDDDDKASDTMATTQLSGRSGSVSDKSKQSSGLVCRMKTSDGQRGGQGLSAASRKKLHQLQQSPGEVEGGMDQDDLSLAGSGDEAYAPESIELWLPGNYATVPRTIATESLEDESMDAAVEAFTAGGESRTEAWPAVEGTTERMTEEWEPDRAEGGKLESLKDVDLEYLAVRVAL